MNCPSHFPFLKLTHWSKWVFSLFLGDQGSFHYIFYQHHGYAAFYILRPRLFELIDHWHFPVILYDWNFNCRSSQRALFSKYSHLPPPIWGAGWLWESQIATWLFERWHFIKTIFSCEGECRQHSGRPARVYMCCKVYALPYKFKSPSPLTKPSLPVLYHSLLWLADVYTCLQTQRKKL